MTEYREKKTTEYRDKSKDWYECQDCKRDFRNSDGSVDMGYNCKPRCPSCEGMIYYG